MQNYNMKVDFLNVGIIMAIFIVALVGLYYYDQQSDVLMNTTEWLVGMF